MSRPKAQMVEVLWSELSRLRDRSAKLESAEKRAELAESLITEIEREAAAFGVSKPAGSITAIERMITRYKAALSAPTKAGGGKDDE